MVAQTSEFIDYDSEIMASEDIAAAHYIGELALAPPIEAAPALTHAQAFNKYNKWLESNGYGLCGIVGYHRNEAGQYVPR